jgi:hypothetical protein
MMMAAAACLKQVPGQTGSNDRGDQGGVLRCSMALVYHYLGRRATTGIPNSASLFWM